MERKPWSHCGKCDVCESCKYDRMEQENEYKKEITALKKELRRLKHDYNVLMHAKEIQQYAKELFETCGIPLKLVYDEDEVIVEEEEDKN